MEYKKKYKFILSLALIGTITGSISLIISSVAIYKIDKNKIDKLKYYLNTQGQAIWGNSIIWQDRWTGLSFSLYFSWKKSHSVDVRWDGTYPENYFDKN